MKEKWFLYTIFLMFEIIPARIALFEDSVAAWIQIAYPRLSIEWGDAFGKPVLNPFEAEIALGVIPGWWEKKKNVLVAKGVYGHGGEGSEDVGEREGVHEEALGKLKGNALGAGGKNVPNALWTSKL
ncbi:hypothetical protein Ahy_A02g007057 [Arachis hypogaea]|uniref:Uncharacterized protein n=1 Tax=Arachis hypogaea TaxID=3818 RepID=A0A445EBP4_ARAHY|nr:hypothetical protein Ahy_A02g007057 [Arachis hypogaea]